MSATLDGDRVAALLGGDGGPAPVVTSESRAHPVDVRWDPRRPREHLEPAVVGAVRRVLRGRGRGRRARVPARGGRDPAHRVRRCATRSATSPSTSTCCTARCPPASRTPPSAPGLPGRRKVVLATDIAETSLTVEGVSIVVDAGLARRPVFDAGTGLTRLETVPASKASADQRAGPGRAARARAWPCGCGRRSSTPPAGRSPTPRSATPTWRGWPSSWRCGAPIRPRCRSSTRRPPGRWPTPASLLVELGALDGDAPHVPTGLGPRDGRPAAAPPPGPHGRRRPRPRAGLAGLPAGRPARGPRRAARPPRRPARPTSGVRLALLDDPGARHPLADGRALRRARDRARDLARRTGVARRRAPTRRGRDPARPRLPRPGRPGPGRRRALRAAGRHRGVAGDRRPAGARAVPRRGRGRRRAAATAASAWPRRWPRTSCVAVARRPGGRARPHSSGTATATTWSPGSSASSAGCASASSRRRPEPGPGRPRGAARPGPRHRPRRCCRGPTAARSVQARVGFLRAVVGEPWPDLSDAALRRDARRLARRRCWPAPPAGPTSTGSTSPARCAGMVPYEVVADLDRLAPEALTVPSGRRVPLRYGEGAPGDPPVLAVRVQQMFGATETPTVAGGRVPVVAAPAVAGRPAGAGHERPGRVLGRVVARRPQGHGRPLPEARLARDIPEPAVTVNRG